MTYATQEDLNTLANLVGTAARAAESANRAAERVCDRVDDLASELRANTAATQQRIDQSDERLSAFVAESQRLFTKIGEPAAQNQARLDRLDGVFSALVKSNDLQQQRIEIQQQQLGTQQQQLDNQQQRLAEAEETLKSVNAAVERLDAIIDRLVG
ncbi:hypothetical protein IQ266_18915 [filamentous cyanobacterium LEGE 11480]|uniref:Uncharacterized protein n=1 Tax=Romeriopsis navalis LEGE 11480 TaxID=2777977 RepID=A0A928VSN3_9CYAN|nr:hypothetical protein [Romeriopsis navalis]MBE9031810.1 hypothetical protein [Romeriopsis navalis LEGE 11480]